ncbi:MAG: folylpolyglutamate synthase/dihydrofolate synthase family protein [Actinomycetota bacterium]|nr:folylpolyglutamate synthase/dihydrofolate synthase family protein [Actinomycetota bacterium]
MAAPTGSSNFSAYLDSLANFGIEPSLDGIEALCRRLGDPQKQFDVIQITGTNGKTSTARMIQALLTAHGVVCGLYLSPHLTAYHERIGVDGAEINDADFEEIGRLVREQTAVAERSLDGRRITQFEAITAAALAYFARRRVQVAVLEVGMGGRWDATSIATPLVAAITNVTMDHADWLGPELADIAGEKSYVIRAGNTVVAGPASPEVEAIFEARAQTQGARLLKSGRDFSRLATTGDTVAIKTTAATYDGIALGVAGPWQPDNAVTAVAAAEAYFKQPFDVELVRRALAAVRSPGRAELVPGEPDIFLDGAHNLDGVNGLVDYLKTRFTGRKLVLLVSILRDKAAPAMVAKLLEAGREIIFTAGDNPRCLKPSELARLAKEHGVSATEEPQAEAALAKAKSEAGESGVVVVTGSLYLVGEIRKLLKNQAVTFP